MDAAVNEKELEILNDAKLYEQMHTTLCTSVFLKNGLLHIKSPHALGVCIYPKHGLVG